MTEQEPSRDKPGIASQPVVWLAASVLIIIVVLLNLKKPAEPEPEPAPVEVVKVKPEPVAAAKPKLSKPKPEPEKIVTKPAPSPPRFDGFIIEGDLSTAGEPWSPNSIIVKVLWIKNKNDEFMLGRETASIQPSKTGLRYQLRLKNQPRQYTNWNNGVEGNIGRVIAYLDLEKDGKLSIHNDKIIAVSKELIRYRTGRFDTETLNEIQQDNIRKEGKGYVIVKQVQLDEEKTDWQVAYRNSPAPVNLYAAETRLPNLYTTMIKMQVK